MPTTRRSWRGREAGTSARGMTPLASASVSMRPYRGRDASVCSASARSRRREAGIALDQQPAQPLVVEGRHRADGVESQRRAAEHRRQLVDELRPALAGEHLQRAPAVVGRGALVADASRDSAGRPRCRRTAARPRRRAAAVRPPARFRRASTRGPVRRRRHVDAPLQPVAQALEQGGHRLAAPCAISATTASALSASTARRAMNCASSGMLLRPACSSASAGLPRTSGSTASHRIFGRL